MLTAEGKEGTFSHIHKFPNYTLIPHTHTHTYKHVNTDEEGERGGGGDQYSPEGIVKAATLQVHISLVPQG